MKILRETAMPARENSQASLYSIFGVTLESDFPFRSRLAAGRGAADLVFSCVRERPQQRGAARQLRFQSGTTTEDARNQLRLFQEGETEVLAFGDVSEFYVWPDRIVCHLLNPAHAHMVEIHLLGIVLSFWLERRGFAALHSSAVVVEGRAAVFMATNHGGKTSLAAALMQAGYAMLSDDILPLRVNSSAVLASAGYPQMRMWPEQADHFLGHHRELDVVHPAYTKRRIPVGRGGFGSFCNHPVNVACFYLPERAEGAQDVGVTIRTVPPGEATIELVRNAFNPQLVQAARLHVRRLEDLAEIARMVPLRRITYPSGWEHLPRVRDALLADLKTLRNDNVS
jgi:hypothetical protein